jgi:hypothetical protein
MPTFSIHIVNSDFASSNSVDASSPEAARSQGMKSALQIGVEEICKGGAFFGAEVRVQNGDEIVERMVVAIGASTLQ